MLPAWASPFAGPGRPVIAFRNIFEGSIRVNAVVTFKDAMTPGPLRRVSVDDWKLEACPHHGPSLAIAPTAPSTSPVHRRPARKGLVLRPRGFGRRSLRHAARLVSARPPAGAPYLLANGPALHLVWKEFDGTRRWCAGRSATTAAAPGAPCEPSPIQTTHRTSAAGRARRAGYLSWLDQPRLSPDPLEDQP